MTSKQLTDNVPDKEYDWVVKDEDDVTLAYKKFGVEPEFIDKDKALIGMSKLIQQQKSQLRGEINRFNAIFIGLKFGYPICCIQEFMQDLHNSSNPYHTRNFPNNKTGFIPCRAHTKEVIEGKISLASLIKNREHDVPFTDWEQPTF